jgi:hypothetical protein
MDHRSIPVLPQTKQQPTDVTVTELQPPGSFHLRELLPLDFL